MIEMRDALEKELGTNLSIERIINTYGVNPNIYHVSNTKQKFFVKVSESLNEKWGYIHLSKYLPVPRLLHVVFMNNWYIYIYEYFEGESLTQLMLKSPTRALELDSSLTDKFISMYENTKSIISLEDYISCKSNDLYLKRLQGHRHYEYYGTATKIVTNLSKAILLNGKLFELSGNEIIQDIITKCVSLKSNLIITSVLGHADAHHQNVLYNSNSLGVIDYEYAGFMPLNMEQAKRYYVDFIGTLFFFFEDILSNCFLLKGVTMEQNLINLKIKISPEFSSRIKLIQARMNSLSKVRKYADGDPLTLNDYLVLCHLYTRNPNNYKGNTQLLFLAVLMVLTEFDPFDLETFSKYF